VKNKKVTVTIAELNTTSTGYQYVETCKIGNSTPKNIYVKNGCGKKVEINFISQEEMMEFTNDPTNFVGIGIDDGDSFSSKDLIEFDPDREIDYILIAKVEAGVATADLDIYCMDYV